jgi:hypothetical protein
MAAQCGGDIDARIAVVQPVQPPQQQHLMADAVAPVIGEIEQQYAQPARPIQHIGRPRQSHHSPA